MTVTYPENRLQSKTQKTLKWKILTEATGLEVHTLKAIEKTKPVLGYSGISTVKLDFDNKSLKTVKYWANRVCRFFKLEGFLILKSSNGSYHVVFNRTVSWTENMHIICWVALMVEGRKLRSFPLTMYALLQGIKESSCLRCGRKENKPSPRIVLRFGKQDGGIGCYLKYRRTIRKIESGTEFLARSRCHNSLPWKLQTNAT